ncbi:DUF2442 domain-containing protein [Fibrobacter sp. UWH4]|uniref:DUF2442 domain-containing protein n=1 Tax=Fibrobacter sp. UWH4 TaxID=1896210 RepID=UPI00091F40EE|nr:DUF2442 domain-containing protein [Fibrobacter sp. UWH4]SHK87110.1 Protein of unknown function [Fibrobacter sp. UWH4]
MYREDIEKIEPVNEGLRLSAKDGRTATLFFAMFDRLKQASPEQRLDFRMSFGGLRWDSLDEDISYDSIFEPENFPLRLSIALRPINMSEVARRLGIQQSLMAAYMNGSKHPSPERQKMICDEIHKIGRELLEV